MTKYILTRVVVGANPNINSVTIKIKLCGGGIGRHRSMVLDLIQDFREVTHVRCESSPTQKNLIFFTSPFESVPIFIFQFLFLKIELETGQIFIFQFSIFNF